jgi:hypothetical protein
MEPSPLLETAQFSSLEPPTPFTTNAHIWRQTSDGTERQNQR